MKIQEEKEVELGVALFVCHSSVPSKQEHHRRTINLLHTLLFPLPVCVSFSLSLSECVCVCFVCIQFICFFPVFIGILSGCLVTSQWPDMWGQERDIETSFRALSSLPRCICRVTNSELTCSPTLSWHVNVLLWRHFSLFLHLSLFLLYSGTQLAVWLS